MTHDQVKKVLNDYFDENLSVEVDVDTQNHINQCSECSQYLYSLQDLMKKVEKLPKSCKPPEDFWQDIFHSISNIKSENIKQQEELELLEAQKSEEAKIEAKKKAEIKTEAEKLLNWERKKAKFFDTLKKPNVRKGIIAGAAVLILFIFYQVFLSKGAAWEFNRLRIGASTPEKTGEFAENDILETNAVSRVEIKIPDVGSVFLEPDSKIQRLPSDKISLINGVVNAIKTGAQKPLTIEVPQAEIKDYFLGGKFTVYTGEDLVTVFSVQEGWTEVKKGEVDALVLSNHTCRIIPDSGLGLPYLNTSSEDFVQAINAYCFSNPGNEEALISILTKADVKNCVTLWNLMHRVTRKQRDMVIYTIFGLLGAPPAGVTDEGLRTLNSEMMLKLIEEIESRI